MSHKKEHTDALLQLCLEGKPSAQLEIYNRYYKAMYNTALRIVKDSAEAEDVMQESFLNAFTKLRTFNPNYSQIFYSKAKLPAIIENARNLFSSKLGYNSFTKKFLRFPILLAF